MEIQPTKVNKNGWLVVTFIIVIIILSFIYGGFWIGIITFLIGSVILGWKDRHKGPFPTNKP
jgi:hypothetical protein